MKPKKQKAVAIQDPSGRVILSTIRTGEHAIRYAVGSPTVDSWLEHGYKVVSVGIIVEDRK